ncbi:MAG: PQQ-dependent sugar dehydrogenase [Pseudomonadota bacterium]|nr:PQQ-dependent sugar dehydrogenase [Pseudomonadota bacterium]
MPPPHATPAAANMANKVAPPAGALPRVPPGFTVGVFASGLQAPRTIRVAPNGDIFVAESRAGRVLILRATDGAWQPSVQQVFARDLELPFGIAFSPPGSNPAYVYMAETNRVVRFPWHPGDLGPSGPMETVVARLSPTSGHHWTRDIAFSPDGRRMYVSVGSGSNDDADMPRATPDQIRQHDAQYGPGSAWGDETMRADVLVFDPNGRDRHVFATGLRNCVGLAIQPGTGLPWCATNERDGLGDNLPPDYVTHVRAGAFYGWPWYYIGDHEDPDHREERPDLAGHVTTPDVLIQPHSAPLGLTFYGGHGTAAFPPEYLGDAFVALHGSWNRQQRTGYKVVRIHLRNGAADGAYEDFLTGFVTNSDAVWGRPVDVATAHDGALLVTEDGNGTIWRIAASDRH